MQSKKFKKLIIANCVLLVLLLAGFTYAWFATSYGNIVEADQVEVIADSALELSFDGENWANYLKFDTSGLEFTDITGSGDSKGDFNATGAFFKPALNQRDGFAEVANLETDPEWAEPKANKDYIKFDLYMRSGDPYDVYLGKDAMVSPQAETRLGLSANDVLNNKSAYGNFSRDLVAGAVRVSAVANANEASHNRLFTWIPCPNIYLPVASNAEITSYKGLTESYTKQSPFNGEGYDPFTHYYYKTEKADVVSSLSEDIEDDRLVTGTITETSQQKLASLVKASSSTYYTGKVTIYIWLEGCDNEARRAFVNGRFNVKLVISAQDQPQESE